MIPRSLPFTPTPLPDELLSSWIERIGNFYAIGYDGAFALLAPYRPRYRDINHDPDTDPEVRAALVNWTGRDANVLPTLLDPSDRGTLDVAARLGYCPQCWDDDVRAGHTPYIRKAWARWTSVLDTSRPRSSI